jgi:Ca-activated chloride channel family protein
MTPTGKTDALAKACSVVTLAAALGLPVPSAGEQASIEFVSPRNLQTVIGVGELVLDVRVPAGLRADRVEVFVDDEPLTTLRQPPWRTTWDAGETGKGHVLEAVLHLSDGSRVEAAVRTSRLRVTHFEEVALVNLYAVVRDRGGDYVTDLDRTDFKVTENGRPQTIERFTTERKPLRVALVIDSSLSMVDKGPRLKKAKEAALKFLEVLGPDDEGMVVTFSDDVRVVQELSTDRATLEEAIVSLVGEGGTALYDSVWRTSRRLGRFDGRRVLVLLSDGRDEGSSGLEPGSLHTLSEALDRALRDEVIIFAIGIGKHLDSEYDFYGRRTVKSILEDLAEKTGGRAVFASSPSKLKKAFEEVADDLRHMYSLAYISDDKRHDGKWREIRLDTSDDRLVVYTRRGYFAPTKDVSASGSF